MPVIKGDAHPPEPQACYDLVPDCCVTQRSVGRHAREVVFAIHFYGQRLPIAAPGNNVDGEEAVWGGELNCMRHTHGFQSTRHILVEPAGASQQLTQRVRNLELL